MSRSPGVSKPSAVVEDASDLLETKFFARHFILGQQHDSEELFRFLMEALKTDKSGKSQMRPTPFWCDEIVLKQQRVRTVGFGRKRPVNPFEGLEAHSVCCDECGYVSSVRFTDFLNLNLFVPPQLHRRTTLADCLRFYTQTERVEDYLCESCSKKATDGIPKYVSIRKRSLLGQLPKALCLHIQIAISGLDDDFSPFKSHASVEFPEVIDMAPYTVSAHAASFFGGDSSTQSISATFSPNVFSPNGVRRSDLRSPVVGGGPPYPVESNLSIERSVSPGNPKENPYRLQAAIVHHGAGIGSGHFTCYRRWGGNNQWVSVSDEQVRLVPSSVVFGSQAYMLMYEAQT